MKKVIAISSLLMINIGVIHAQVDKGTIPLGAGFGLESNSQRDPNGNLVSTAGKSSLSLDGSYFFMDKFAFGGKLTFLNNSSKRNNDSDPDLEQFQTRTLSLTPYLRYYHMIKENFGFFAQGGIPIFSSTSYVDNNKTESSLGAGLEILPGLVYFPHPKFGLEASLGLVGFTSAENKDKDGNKTGRTTTTNFGAGSTSTLFNLGFKYYLSN